MDFFREQNYENLCKFEYRNTIGNFSINFFQYIYFYWQVERVICFMWLYYVG